MCGKCAGGSGDATPGRARSNDPAGRATALAPPCLLLCFVTVWTENTNATISDRFFSDGETISGDGALAACVLRATTKKGRQLFLRKKVHPQIKNPGYTPPTPGDLAWEFSNPRNDLAPLLLWRRHALRGRGYSHEIAMTAILLFFLTLGINIHEGLKNYATQCKEARMVVSRLPGQSCHVVKLHFKPLYQNRDSLKQKKLVSLLYRLTEEKSCDPGLTENLDHRTERMATGWKV